MSTVISFIKKSQLEILLLTYKTMDLYNLYAFSITIRDKLISMSFHKLYAIKKPKTIRIFFPQTTMINHRCRQLPPSAVLKKYHSTLNYHEGGIIMITRKLSILKGVVLGSNLARINIEMTNCPKT